MYLISVDLMCDDTDQQPVSFAVSQVCVTQVSGGLQDPHDTLHVTGETEAIVS